MANPSWIGRKLSDRYEIEDLLGQGGMSSVYKANDPNLRRTVAVKLIHSHLSNDEQFISRFEEEAASVAQLRHSNIIQVYDFSNDSDTYYMILEFVPGETVEQQLDRLSAGNKRMATKEAVKMAASICDALEYANNRGLIHRDIKPANIMINLQGDAILMDFGVAKIIGGKQHTATGAIVGTALYMSPEIIQGQQPDKLVDIYALGVTLYEALTGEPPFKASSAMSTMMMHINDPVPDLRKINPDVPEALVNVIKKALSKKKEDRFQSASEFANALREIDLSIKSLPVNESPAGTMVEQQPPAGTMVEQPAVDAATPQQTMVEQSIPAQPSGAGATMIEHPPTTQPKTSSKPSSPKSQNKLKELFSNPLIIGAVVIGVLFIGVIGFFGLRALSSPVAPTSTNTPEVQIPTNTTVVEVVVIPPTETLVPTIIPEDTATPTPTDPPGPYAQINGITLNSSGTYIVDYETFGYTENLPGMHVHFFFNSVQPSDAGVGGSGPWIVWGGPRPFNAYTTSHRPGSATQMCALVANSDHTITLETGNCVDLP